ncbi:hypothetical protein SUGI_0911820 [Cryptomeria japonica]|nr:hypothetical protein SUGI_0911820 [Cryptomeria japonica]
MARKCALQNLGKAEDGDEDLREGNQEGPVPKGCTGGKDEFVIDLSMEISTEKALWEDFAVIARIIGPKLSRAEINNWILNQENWFVNGNPIYLQPWSPNFDPTPLVVYDSPVWIRLYNLPIEYWDDVVLEKIDRSLGTLLEVDEQIIENNLYKFVRLRIATVQRIPSHITLSTTSSEWRQQVEIEKAISPCSRCGSRLHSMVNCRMFVRRARGGPPRKEKKVWKKMVTQPSQAVIHKETPNKEAGEPLINEAIITFPLELSLKNQVMEDDNLSKEGRLEAGHDSNGCAISTGVENSLIHKPFFKGSSDTEIEYDLGSKEDFKSVDELDNVDQRCISQSANTLLGKAKGMHGRRSNRQVREAGANEKGIDKSIGRKNVKWCSPLLGWKKLNFDGASRGNPGLSSFGVVVKDEDGSFAGAICGPSRIVSNNVAEITALEEGFNWVIANNHLKVVIEGDSQIILNGVTKKSFTNWRLNEWIPRIDQLIKKLEDYQVKHIYHEGNCVADLLANQGVIESQTKVVSVVDSMFKDLSVLLEMDKDEIPRKGIGCHGKCGHRGGRRMGQHSGTLFNTIVYLSDVKCSDSEDEEQVAAVALKAKKEEFMHNVWEVFCVGVKNDNMDPFKQMMRTEEGWLSEGSVERVALIGSRVATILRLI